MEYYLWNFKFRDVVKYLLFNYNGSDLNGKF